MIKFRDLFSFTQKEIDYAFKQGQSVKKCPGLRLIQAPLAFTTEEAQNQRIHGKLLIITPRKTGKAHMRNLLRRRAKAIFYTNELYKKPVLSVFSMYHEASKLSFDQLQAFLVSCLKENR